MELDSQESPREIKGREVELDSQESPREIKGREVELDSQESPREIKGREMELDSQGSPGDIKGREVELDWKTLTVLLQSYSSTTASRTLTLFRTAVETAVSGVHKLLGSAPPDIVLQAAADGLFGLYRSEPADELLPPPPPPTSPSLVSRLVSVDFKQRVSTTVCVPNKPYRFHDSNSENYLSTAGAKKLLVIDAFGVS